MTRYKPVRLASVGILAPILLASLSMILSAQTVKIQGMIKARSGATMLFRLRIHRKSSSY